MVTVLVCLCFQAGQGSLPQNNFLWLSCLGSPLRPLDQKAAVTVADQSYHTRKDLSSICLFSVLLHITTTPNLCHPLTEESTLFPHQTKILMLKDSTGSKHFKSPELAFSALTVISESLIFCTGRHIWVEPEPALQDRRWMHKQWVRCWFGDRDARVHQLTTQSCWALSLEPCLFSNWEMWLQDGRHTSASLPAANYGIGCKYLPSKAIQTRKEHQVA